jgi:tetratricopeptide (TPR) repeat protein
MKHRWPRSLHSQTEAVFHAIRSFREAKTDSPLGLRAFGSWESYRNKAHRFVGFMAGRGRSSLLDILSVRDDMAEYLERKLAHYVERKRSRQTMETLLSALGKFEYALNQYIEQHGLDIPPLETEALRLEYYARSRKLLRISSRAFANRAYPDPVRLIEAIYDGTCQLQAALQYEGGLRAEGVGAPSNCRVKNPLAAEGLHGIGSDPVTGAPVGIVASVEKGGKETEHYVSVETYRRLEEYIRVHGRLESDYADYVAAINRAARETGQYAPGRGSHGLKHNFAQERYLECIRHGLTHEQALQQTSLETSHFRLRETLTYTRG